MRWNEAIRLVRCVCDDDIGSERDRGVQRVDCTIFARFHMLDMYVTSTGFRESAFLVSSAFLSNKIFMDRRDTISAPQTGWS